MTTLGTLYWIIQNCGNWIITFFKQNCFSLQVHTGETRQRCPYRPHPHAGGTYQGTWGDFFPKNNWEHFILLFSILHFFALLTNGFAGEGGGESGGGAEEEQGVDAEGREGEAAWGDKDHDLVDGDDADAHYIGRGLRGRDSLRW